MAPRKPIPRIYEEHAGWFALARQQGKFSEREYLETFARRLPPGGTVLDLGCGNGRPMAEVLIGWGFRVTGFDVSEPLLAMARSAFPRAKWIHGDMRKLDLKRRFDGILAWHSFFHLERDEQRAMFPLFRTHLAPGGRLMFTSGPADGEAIGKMCGDELYHASLSPEEYRSRLAEQGLLVELFESAPPASGGPTVWIAEFPKNP